MLEAILEVMGMLGLAESGNLMVVRSQIAFRDFRRCVRTRFQEFSLPRTRVPHISLVFREMWDTANLDLPLANRGAEA